MKIAFLGDSITEGIPGVNYVNLIKTEFPDYQIDNYGKGGDTVLSLLKRIRCIKNLADYDLLFVVIGVNDLYGKLTVPYRVLKRLKKQPASKDINAFKDNCELLIEHLESLHTKIVFVPPLLMGEQLDSNWNQQLNDYVSVMKETVSGYQGIDVINVRENFLHLLKGKITSRYLPLKLIDLYNDVTKLKNINQVDEISHSRGLYLTLDGVHLNSIGATEVSTKIIEYLKGV